MLRWAEQASEIRPADYEDIEEEQAVQISGELFNLLTTSLTGEPLQVLYNCNFNGVEAWRRLARRYSPTTPLRAMHLMLQILSPEKAKNLSHVQSHIKKWEAKVLASSRDFREELSERMKSAILISTLPDEIRNTVLQQPEKFEECGRTRERMISMIEARLAMRSPDEMEVDLTERDEDEQYEDIEAVGKGGIHGYRCGGQGHIAAKCATPEPPTGKGKGNQKGKDGGKGKSKGKGKAEWTGDCSYCGQRGHSPRDCWTKQKDEASGEGWSKGGVFASVDGGADCRGESAEDACVFDITHLDVDHGESVQIGGDMNTIDVLELGTSKRKNHGGPWGCGVRGSL